MGLEIRRAVLASDGPQLRHLIQTYLAPESGERRFTWLYQNGPHGTARAWIAYDSSNRNVVGTAAAFPRKIYFDGTERLAWVLGDFCMTEKYRSLGPALALQRKCLADLSPKPDQICYDFPSQSMAAIYQRLGIHEASAVVRWAKPLRSAKRLEATVHSRLLARGLGVLADAALARRGWRGQKSGCELAVHQTRCGAEFDVLDCQLRQQPGIRTSHSADYLNWRYLDHPGIRYEILTVRMVGRLIGYGVFTKEGEYAYIADLVSVEEPPVIARLLNGIVGLLRSKAIVTVSLQAGDSHPWSSLFERAGFQRRERAPVIVYPQEPSSRASSSAGWYLMQGDRDS